MSLVVTIYSDFISVYNWHSAIHIMVCFIQLVKLLDSLHVSQNIKQIINWDYHSGSFISI